jgi:hypothetical protein
MPSPTLTDIESPATATSSFIDFICLASGAALVAAVPLAGVLWFFGSVPFTQTFFLPSVAVFALAFACVRQLSRRRGADTRSTPSVICAGLTLPLACALIYGMSTYVAPTTPYSHLAYGPSPALLPSGRDWDIDPPIPTYVKGCVNPLPAEQPLATTAQAGGLQRVSVSAAPTVTCAP